MGILVVAKRQAISKIFKLSTPSSSTILTAAPPLHFAPFGV
jgi:hypothetical protein